MALALQLFGGLIVAAAVMQACVGLVSQFNGAIRQRKMDQRKLVYFKTQTANLIKQDEVERERTELTWSGKRKFRVVERRIENQDGNICSFYLAPHDGGKLPTFQPGQFLTFELAVPGEQAPVVRCYSLSDSPLNSDQYRVSIKKLPPPRDAKKGTPGGLASSYFHDYLQEDDMVDVMAPNGGFVLDTHSDRPVVLIGGGVGLTPVLSMLKWLAETNSNREVWFFYGVIHGDDIALRDEINAIISDNSHFHSVIAFSNPTKKCVEGQDYDISGRLSVDVMKNYLKNSNYEFYICGPPPMMESLTEQLQDWGVPEDDINMEAFGPASVKRIGKSELSDAEISEGFNVEFTRTGKSLVWTSDAGTLLELADANGIRISSGCRVGNCHSCITALKDGKVAYIKKPTGQVAQGSALVCISQPDGDISLDA